MEADQQIISKERVMPVMESLVRVEILGAVVVIMEELDLTEQQELLEQMVAKVVLPTDQLTFPNFIWGLLVEIIGEEDLLNQEEELFMLLQMQYKPEEQTGY